MMKVPPSLNLVGMERLPLPLPFSPHELFWRSYNSALTPHSGPPPSPSAAAAAAVALSRATIHSPLNYQLPFAYDIKHTIPISLASDPRLWSREDVVTFLRWCEREFDLPYFDIERFQMNGKALCLLTKTDLESRAPCSGDVIHNALHLLTSNSESPLTPQTPSSARMLPLTPKDLQSAVAAQQNGTTSVTLSPAPSLDGQGSPPEHGTGNGGGGSNQLSSSSSTGSAGVHSDDSEYDSVGDSTGEHSPSNPQSSSASPPSPPPPPTSASSVSQHHLAISYAQPSQFNGSSSKFLNGPKLNNNGGSGDGEYNNNGRLLWDFLQQLLNDPAQRYNSFIAWKNPDTGIFKIVDPPGLARLWGIQKNHLSMNYDKMSRALRYYYRVNILRKVQGERHCYQFLRNPGELKSIKNISMLRHQQNSPISLTVKSEPLFPEPEPEYDDDMPTDLSMDSERHLKEEAERNWESSNMSKVEVE